VPQIAKKQMSNPKNILFITWDGPQTSYMEGLFMPIFAEIQKKSNYKFHVIQFTWGSNERIAITQEKAVALDIIYNSYKINRKPVATIGSLITLYKGIKYLRKYIKKNSIDIVMPRSTMPTIMVNRLKIQDLKILFDADGLAIEERVDFSGLTKTSKQYRFFSKEERKIVAEAQGVITRSQKAIEYHLAKNSRLDATKFDVVFNGRNVSFFNFNPDSKVEIQKKLGFTDANKVFVYCGSLGAQYCWDEMLAIFTDCYTKDANFRFLILSGNPEFLDNKIPNELQSKITVKKVPFEQVPQYLSVANFAFAIREPKPSMQAIAPIKLGEYLLMGIPTIASMGIGDSEAILQDIPNCHLYNHSDIDKTKKAVTFVTQNKPVLKQEIRNKALHYFSLEKSAESYIIALDKLYSKI